MIGDQSYLVCISTGVEDNAPSGDRLYILTKKFDKKMQSQHPVRSLIYGGSYQMNLGKRAQNINIHGIIVSSDINSAIALLDKSIVANLSYPATKLYLFVKNSATTYLKFAKKTPRQYSDYLPGVVESYNISWQESSKVYEISLIFNEVWGF